MFDPQEPGFDAEARAKITALAENMRRNGSAAHDPVRSVMGLLGDRWSTLILLVLETGTWRHAELRRVTTSLASELAISQRVLTLKLRALEREGMLARHVTADVPPRVSYSLTELGGGLIQQVHAMIDWIGDHQAAILDCRAAFDAQDAAD